MARTAAREALVVVEDVLVELLVGLAGREYHAALDALGRRLGVAVLAYERVVLALDELLAAEHRVARVTRQALGMIRVVLVRANGRRRLDRLVALATIGHLRLENSFFRFDFLLFNIANKR